MHLSRERLEAEAAMTGFRPEALEKVAYLLALLEGFNRHPFLKGKLALKGGTAINLFLFDLPRLSADIDLNYVGAADRETMLKERPKVEEAITAVCQREGLAVQKVPTEHAGGSWNLRYRSVYGNTDSLKIDVVYMYRIPLWPVIVQDSRPVGSLLARQVLVLDEYELAAGKLAALLARQTSRDLFDTRALLSKPTLDRDRLRLGFVVYGGMNRKDWRTVTIDDIESAARDLESYLVPLLRKTILPDPFDAQAWAKSLVTECKQALRVVLPLEPHEREFLDRLLDAGEIAPDLLTQDAALAERIQHHPDLIWKALNVRNFKAGKKR